MRSSRVRLILNSLIVAIFVTVVLSMWLSILRMGSVPEETEPSESKDRRDPYKQEVRCLAFSPDGKAIATGHQDGLVMIWDTVSGAKRCELTGHSGRVAVVAFSPDGRTLASGGSDRTARLWDTVSMRPRAVLAVPSDWVVTVAFSPDGNSLLTGGIPGAQVLRRWDVATGQEEARPFELPGPVVQNVALSPDGEVLASTGHDWGATVQLWDVATGTKSFLLASGEPSTGITVDVLAFSLTGKTLGVSGGEDRRVRVWDVASGKLLRSFGRPLAFYEKASLAISPDSTSVARVGSMRGGEMSADVELWDIATGRSLGAYHEFAQPFTCVAFSPDGRTLATGSIHESGLVFLWDVDRSQLSSTRPLKPRATFR